MQSPLKSTLSSCDNVKYQYSHRPHEWILKIQFHLQVKDDVVRGVPGRVYGLEGTVSLDLEGRPILDEVVLESSAQRDLVLVLPGKLEDLAVGLKTELTFLCKVATSRK